MRYDGGMARRLRLLLTMSLGVLVGGVTQCGGESPLGGECVIDAQCVIACPRVGCCREDCPCKNAVPLARLAQMEEEDVRRCGDTKVACPITPMEACDFDLRWRAACRGGACVAEELAGGASAEFRAPDVPAHIEATDSRCRDCWPATDTKETTDCRWPVSWRCGEDEACRLGVPCDPACCDRHPTK